MKKLLLSIAAMAVITASFSSCASMKKDCQGNKHVRLKNGIYL